MSILPLLRTTGGLPLAQLSMRASGSAGEVLAQVKALVEEGLVTVEGDRVPQTEDQLKFGQELVKLTRLGTQRAFR